MAATKMTDEVPWPQGMIDECNRRMNARYDNPLTEAEIQDRMWHLLASDAADGLIIPPGFFCFYDLAGWTEKGRRYRKRALELTAATEEKTMTAEKSTTNMIGADETDNRTPAQVEHDRQMAEEREQFRGWNAMKDAGNQTVSAILKPVNPVHELRQRALELACRTYGDQNPADKVIETAAKFEAYLRRGDPMFEEVPTAAAQREELVGGMERQPDRETMSEKLKAWTDDRKFGAGPDVQFQATEHDKS